LKSPSSKQKGEKMEEIFEALRTAYYTNEDAINLFDSQFEDEQESVRDLLIQTRWELEDVARILGKKL